MNELKSDGYEFQPDTTERVILLRDTTWWLTGRLSETEPIRQICVDRSPFEVGRENGLALSIPHVTISGRHAEFTIDKGKLRLRDLGSTNGTFVNGDKISGECALDDGDLVQFAEVVFRVGVRSTETELETQCEDGAERAMALIQFDRLMAERAVMPFAQPIIALRDRRVIGYEMLARSRFYGLTDPKSMFQAAALLDAEADLSRLLRTEGMRVAKPLPGHQSRLLNTHPKEMQDPAVLIMSMRELRDAHPTEKIVLEIHEGSITKSEVMREIKAQLTDLDVKLAYDDFGSGQARLDELIKLPPDYLKFDLHLIQGIEDADSQQQRVLRVLVEMVHDIGVIAVAEGIETEGAHEVCRDMGFELGQGYLYGRPAPVKTYLRNE